MQDKLKEGERIMPRTNMGIPAKIYQTELDIESKITLGAMASKIVKHHQGENMITIIITQMLSEVCSSIRYEEDNGFYIKDFMEKLQAKKEIYEKIKTLIEEASG